MTWRKTKLRQMDYVILWVSCFVYHYILHMKKVLGKNQIRSLMIDTKSRNLPFFIDQTIKYRAITWTLNWITVEWTNLTCLPYRKHKQVKNSNLAFPLFNTTFFFFVYLTIQHPYVEIAFMSATKIRKSSSSTYTNNFKLFRIYFSNF